MALEEKDGASSCRQNNSHFASFVVNLVVNCEVNNKILLEKPFGGNEWYCPEVHLSNGEGFVDAVSRWGRENVFLRKVSSRERMLSLSVLINEIIIQISWYVSFTQLLGS